MIPTDLIDPPDTATQAIIAAAYNLPGRATPRYGARATVTSDGFLIADFTGRDGFRHMGAFVGSLADLNANIEHFIDHFSLTQEQADDLRAKIRGWYCQ